MLVSLIHRGKFVFQAWEKKPLVPTLEFTRDDFEATLVGLYEVDCAYYHTAVDSVTTDKFNHKTRDRQF